MSVFTAAHGVQCFLNLQKYFHNSMLRSITLCFVNKEGTFSNSFTKLTLDIYIYIFFYPKSDGRRTVFNQSHDVLFYITIIKWIELRTEVVQIITFQVFG